MGNSPTTFNAFRIHDEEGAVRAGFERLTLDDLSSGEVVIRAAYSGVNYKDALAATGMGKILRKYPLVGGIDVAGTVTRSTSTRFRDGDAVVVCGCGLSEDRDGGYAEYVRVPASFPVHLPGGLSLREAMGLGTAGFTAALAVARMEQNGQKPDLGPVLVNGATGGVGSFAIDILHGLGYSVTAISGKEARRDYLRLLGAEKVIDRSALEMGTRPLEKALWGGAVDNVGGPLLSWLTRTVVPWGNIAAIGLVGGIELETTVMPFILRGVSLLGINSVHCPQGIRDAVWQRLGGDLKPAHLDQIVTREVPLADLPSVFEEHLRGDVVGRTVVRIS